MTLLIGKMAIGPNSLGHSCISSAGRISFVSTSANMKESLVFCSLKWQAKQMSNGTVCAIAADDDRSGKLQAQAFLAQRHAHVIVMLDCRDEFGFVLQASALTPQLFTSSFSVTSWGIMATNG